MIEAVVRDVQLPADEPFGVRAVPLEHLVPLLEPVQLVRLLAPEGFGTADRLAVESVVFLAALDQRVRREAGGPREQAGFPPPPFCRPWVRRRRSLYPRPTFG